VLITGTNLLNVSEVSIGGLSSRIMAATNSNLTIAVPDDPITGDVIITSSGGAPKTVGKIIFPPRVSKINPDSGPAKSEVTVEGANLADVAGVQIGDTEAPIKTKEATRLVFEVPEDAHTAKIKFLPPSGFSYANLISKREFVAQPVITALAPAKAGQGIKVTLTGFNFEDVSKVQFGEAEANFEFAKKADGTNDAARLIVTVPEGAVSGPITVTTKPNLVGVSKAFTFVPMPAVPDFPTSVVAGQELDIVGTNLADVQKIKIGVIEIPKTAIKVNTPTNITLTVPVGTETGKISITTEGGTIISPQPLTVTAAP
jgi:hypothetical protein